MAQLRLAFPSINLRAGTSANAATAIRTFETALRQDLEASGVFQIQGPEDLAVLTLTGVQATDFELYRSLTNQSVLVAEAYEEEDKFVVEGRLYDLASQQSILGKRYRGTFDLSRRVAHTFSDEIVLYFTGARGIALTSIAFNSDRTGHKEIYLMDYDGENVRPLTGHNSISMSPAWAPTGDNIAYVSFFAGPPGIYRVDLATGAKQPIVTDGNLNSSPDFSADGRKIAFTRSLEGNTEIFVADRDGSNLRQVTRSAGIDTNPAFSPNGTKLAFTSSRAGNPHIYIMDVDGTNLQRVTFEGTYNDGAEWSPDGTRIAYSTRRGRAFDIAVTDLALLDTKVLTTAMPGSHESPTWSPDGRRIAFSTTDSSKSQIRVMTLDTGAVLVLTSEGNNMSPDWSPYPPR
jgi:TolB protein